MFEGSSESKREDRKWLRSFEWDYLVLDEAHGVKNLASERAKQLLRVARKSKCRLLLTGTPVQNSLKELIALLCFAQPKLFGADVNDALQVRLSF